MRGNVSLVGTFLVNGFKGKTFIMAGGGGEDNNMYVLQSEYGPKTFGITF